MSTIAAMPGVMAADGLEVDVDSNIILSFEAQKIYRLSDGRLAAAAGDSFDAELFIAWLEDETLPRPKLKEFEGIVMDHDGSLATYSNRLVKLPAEYPYAIGHGRDFALAILDAGGPIEAAIRAAAKRSVFTGGKISVVYLGDK